LNLGWTKPDLKTIISHELIGASMANINDFKLLNTKCRAYFDLLEQTVNHPVRLRKESNRERFGFYLFALESICNLRDIPDILNLITDTEFNTDVYGDQNNDYGVDAIFIDEDNHYINLFNFKFKERFDEGSQTSINETFLTMKFVNIIIGRDTSNLTGKIKSLSEELIECLFVDNEVWKLRLYVVSNYSREIDVNRSEEVQQLKNLYGLEVEIIGLDKISKIMSIRPKPVDAVLHIEATSVLPYAESKLSSAKSYVIKISAADLIRITCDNPDYRDSYNMENTSVLSDVEMEYDLLFDNVRGLILKSTFNDNILETLRDEPGRFFMYNNGLTVISNDIIADPTNVGQKIKITLKDFQVVNGGQTLRTIHKFNQQSKDNIINHLSNCDLLMRVFKTSSEGNTRNKIAEYTNSQNAISKIDLKSLSSEQILIEQFLREHNIAYIRKIGDTGTSSAFKIRISMEKFGQILFSIQGFPEKASNQKKQIFDKYYEDVFVKKFDMSKATQYINRYYEIKKAYEDIVGLKDATDQKIFYILYLDTKADMETRDEITFLEDVIKSYSPYENKTISDARKLIRIDFKQVLDEKIDAYLKS
jgi:hypothetical protein